MPQMLTSQNKPESQEPQKCLECYQLSARQQSHCLPITLLSHPLFVCACVQCLPLLVCRLILLHVWMLLLQIQMCILVLCVCPSAWLDDPRGVCELFWRSVCSNGEESDSSCHLFHQTVGQIKGNEKTKKTKRQGTFVLACSLEAAWSMTSPFTRPRKKKRRENGTYTHACTQRNTLVDKQIYRHKKRHMPRLVAGF